MSAMIVLASTCTRMEAMRTRRASLEGVGDAWHGEMFCPQGVHDLCMAEPDLTIASFGL